VQDEFGEIFGGYVPVKLHKSHEFFGTGEAFLFKVEVESQIINIGWTSHKV